MFMMIDRYWDACCMLHEDRIVISGATHFIDTDVTELVKELYGIDCFVFITIDSNEIVILTESAYVIMDMEV